jgi:YhcH/YjgK/YiaL family protein
VILDRLSNANIYRRLSERFAAGFDYLSRDLSNVPDGRYEIIGGDEVFAMVQSYQTKPREQGKWEAHRKYADIQFIIAGRECMGIAPIEAMRTQTPYDAEQDLEFFTGTGDGQFMTVEEGSFAIFLPHDVHMPTIAIDAPGKVKKVVVKVRLG